MKAIFATMLLALCVSRETSAQDLRATLMDVDRAFNRATSARGIEGWVEYAAEDASFMPDGVDFVRGKDAVRKFYAPMFSRPGFSLTWEPIEAVVAASGELRTLAEPLDRRRGQDRDRAGEVRHDLAKAEGRIVEGDG